MNPLFSDSYHYKKFIKDMATVIKSVRYSFTYLFDEPTDNIISEAKVYELIEHDQYIEQKMFGYLYPNRIHVDIQQTNVLLDKNYPLKLVTIYASVNPGTMNHFLEYTNFYDLNVLVDPYDGGDYLEADVHEYVDDLGFGEASFEFYDCKTNLILKVNCEKGSYEIGPNYQDIIKQYML